MAPNNPLPIWGNEKTMNLNALILTNIQSSPYFKVNLYELKTYHEVIDEIYYKVSHLEPWEKGSRKTAGQTGMCGGVRGVGAGGIVSSAFCLLYKLFTLRLTKKQVIGLITHRDSPYIRALGFMYIRFTQPPQELWDWFEAYLDDEEEIDVKAGGGHSMTIGEMLRHWFTKLEWYSTLFPRIPVPTQKDLDEKLKARALSKAQDGKPVGPLPVICNGDERMEEEAEEWHEEEPNATVDVGSKGSRSPERRRYDRSCDKSTPHRSPQNRKSPDRHRSSHSPHRRKSPRHRSRSPHHRKSSPPPLTTSSSSSHRKLSPNSGHGKYSSSYSSSAQHSSSMDDFAVELARERERQRRERERDCNGKPKDHHHHHHRHHHHRHRHHHSSSKSKDKEPGGGGGGGKTASLVKEKHQSSSRSPNRSRSHEKNHSKRSHSKEHKHSKAPSMLSASSKHKKRSRSKSVEERPSGDGGNRNHKSRSHHKKDHSQDGERREKKSKKKKHDRNKSKENGDYHN